MSTPVDDLLRVEVRRLKTLTERRRRVPALLNVGDLAGARLVVPLTALGAHDDVALAADVLHRAFDRLAAEPALGGSPQVWLTRGGDLEAGDADWRWAIATADVRRRHAMTPGRFAVVTRHGWLELPSGRARRWNRMRASWCPPYDDDRIEVDGPDPVEGWPVRF